MGGWILITVGLIGIIISGTALFIGRTDGMIVLRKAENLERQGRLEQEGDPLEEQALYALKWCITGLVGIVIFAVVPIVGVLNM